MRRFLKLGSSAPEASQASATAAEAVPTSGFTFVDNSQGLSVATAALSAAFGEAFDQVDLDGPLNARLKDLLHNLDEEASTFENSKIQEDQYPQWNCSRQQAQLISVACKCAMGAYDAATDIPNTSFCSFERADTIDASAGGSVKASTFTVVDATEAETSESFLPALVVAVRGSANMMDHMVNSNERQKDTDHFFNNRSLGHSYIQSHSGFLNSAERLEQLVSRKIKQYITKKGHERCHIVFTGHSAGGAVASLLFLRFLTTEDASFSCITFGAPPTLTEAVDLTVPQLLNKPRLVLNIINEFDLVTRVDRPYVISLLGLLHLRYRPNERSDTEQENSDHVGIAAQENAPSISGDGAPADLEVFLSNSREPWLPSETKRWGLPPAFYHHVGPKVVFFMRLQGEQLGLRAVEVSTAEFEKLVFCRLTVHKKSTYAERVDLFESGRINSQAGWSNTR